MMTERLLTRLTYLVSEFRCLRWSAVALAMCLELASFQLQQRRDPPPMMGQLGPITCVAMACLCWLNLAWCVNKYAVAMQRVRRHAQRVAAVTADLGAVSADFGFEQRDTQDRYERWRIQGTVWSYLDYSGLVLNLLVHLKTGVTAGCGPLHQLWLLVPTALHLHRIRHRRKLSPTAYSALGLAVCAYIWGSQVAMILWGDYLCVGGIAQEMLTASVSTAMLIAWLGYFVVSLPVPVAQSYVPLKTGVNMLGCTSLCYTHVLLGKERVGIGEEQEWGCLLWLLFAVSLAAMSEFLLGVEQNEMSLARFLATFQQSAPLSVDS